MKRLPYFSFFRALAASVLLFGAPDAAAQGDLLISPRRVVLGGSKRTEELNLANTGKDTLRYLISTLEARMKDDGAFEIVDPAVDSTGAYATPHIRFFPRSVVLGPGEAQTVRVQISGAAALEEGEYRSHLYFRAAPPQAPLGEEEAGGAAAPEPKVAVVLKPVFGISIPVILRVGGPTATAALSDLRFTPGNQPKIDLTFLRSGSASLYGDLLVEHVGSGGAVTPVGRARGIAVYTPNARRAFTLPLTPAAGVDLGSGRLRVRYTDGSSKEITLAEGELAL